MINIINIIINNYNYLYEKYLFIINYLIWLLLFLNNLIFKFFYKLTEFILIIQILIMKYYYLISYKIDYFIIVITFLNITPKEEYLIFINILEILKIIFFLCLINFVIFYLIWIKQYIFIFIFNNNYYFFNFLIIFFIFFFCFFVFFVFSKYNQCNSRKILQIHVIAKTIRQQDSVLEESIRKCEKTIACVVLSV